MLYGIDFYGKWFDKKDNMFTELTNNTIIICNNVRIMTRLAEEIINTVNGKAEYNDYVCDDEDVGKAKYIINFGLQKIIDINGQRITLGLEPAMVYKSKRIEDVWFFDWTGKGDTYREHIYSLDAFIGSHETWKEGLDAVYKDICTSRYGGYDGRWIKLKESEPDV